MSFCPPSVSKIGVCLFYSRVSSEGMKMRGMKNETNGSAKANKVVSDDFQTNAGRLPSRCKAYR